MGPISADQTMRGVRESGYPLQIRGEGNAHPRAMVLSEWAPYNCPVGMVSRWAKGHQMIP